MLLPAIKSRNKKGLSIVIGYVLLMTVSIVMSVVVYQWLKTYVPKDALNCPDGTSFFIKEIECTGGTLTIQLKNNGRFGIDGYFIHGSINPNEDALATIDLSSKFIGNEMEIAEKVDGSSIKFNSAENSLSPEENSNTQTNSFDVSDIGGTLTKIELIPIRQQITDNIKRIVSCSDAKIETAVTCA